MVEIMLLSVLLMMGFGFSLFFLVSVYPAIKLIKLRVLQSNMGINVIHKSVQEQEKILQQLLNAEDKRSPFSNSKSKEDIESQYDRAKNVLQKGIMDEKDILECCDITLEEMELLTGLIKKPEHIS